MARFKASEARRFLVVPAEAGILDTGFRRYDESSRSVRRAHVMLVRAHRARYTAEIKAIRKAVPQDGDTLTETILPGF